MASDQAVKAAGPDARAAGERSGGGVLANRDFVKLWAGETVSPIGTQITQFAMPLVAILTLNATVLQVGVLAALRFVPVIVVALVAGVVLDRRRRRPVLIGCALGNAVLIGLVPLSAATGFLSIGLLYAVTALVGTLTVFFEVGGLSYVPSLVEPRHLSAANGKLQASNAVAGISGPGLAGLLVGLLTAPITLSVDAASYVFSAVSLILIKKPEPAPQVAAGRVSVRRSIAEGLRAVYGSRLLRVLLAQSAALNVGFGAVSTVFTVYAIRVLGLTPVKLGFTVGALAVGSLFGALSATRVAAALGLGRALAVAIVGVSVSPLLLLLPRGAGVPALAVLAAGWLGHGCGISVWNVNTVTLRQTVTPRWLLGRMNASYRMLLFGALPAGAIAGGLLGRAVGLRDALVISVIALTSPLLWIAFSPVFRLSQMPTGPPPAMAEAAGPPDAGGGRRGRRRSGGAAMEEERRC